MGVEDMVQKAKNLVEDAVTGATSKAGEVSPKLTGALAGTKESMHDAGTTLKGTGEGIVDRIKGAVTDEHVQRAAETIKSVTPDGVDRIVDRASEAIKRVNN
jgi:hypothetical protein